MTIKIELYGGPGAGKSSTAHWIMWYIKRHGLYTAELAVEKIKRAAYAGRQISLDDQKVYTSLQCLEDRAAVNTGADFVVCESPVNLGLVYIAARGGAGLSQTTTIIEKTDLNIPEENKIRLNCKREKAYQPKGRWQAVEAAKDVDKDVERLLEGKKFFDVYNIEDVKLILDPYLPLNGGRDAQIQG